jgi:hypothetical protein
MKKEKNVLLSLMLMMAVEDMIIYRSCLRGCMKIELSRSKTKLEENK